MRKLFYRIIKNQYFDWVIIGFIILTSIKLALDSYLTDDLNQIEISNAFDHVFNAIFTMECVLKVIALGFIYEETTYLRDSWNQLDFVIVVLSLVEYTMNDKKMPVLKVVRLTRVLRPLRFISRNQNMKLVVIALLESFAGIANVVVVILLCWVMICILGINFVKMKMGYCDVEDSYYGINKQRCLEMGMTWKIFPWNMDNIVYAMLSIFVFASLEGWNDLVANYLDSDDAIYGPSFENRMWILSFNLTLIYLCAFFFIDLFVGVIFLNYVLAEEKIKNKHVTANQLHWIQIQKQIIKEKNGFLNFRTTSSPWRQKVNRFITYKSYFDNTIMLVITMNIVTMCLSYDDESNEHIMRLQNANDFFIAVFLIECLMKIYGMEFYQYWSKSANKFDFGLVLLSLGDLMTQLVTVGDRSKVSALGIAPQIARIFRVLRVTRIFKLIKSFKGLSSLIQTTFLLLPAMMNIMSLMFLLFMIFAILATFLFKDIQKGDSLNDSSVNFKNFGNSFIMMFRMSTGEDWHLIMYDCMAVNKLYGIYFIIYVILFQYIMVNLFVLVILREFDNHFYNTDNPLNQYEQDVEVFKQYWNQISVDYQGVRINKKQLLEFYITLPKPLGLEFQQQISKIVIKQQDIQNKDKIESEIVEETDKEKEIRTKNSKNFAAKILMQMNVNSDTDGNLYFHDLLYAFIKRAYSKLIKCKQGSIAHQIIKKAEDHTLKRLSIRRNKQFMTLIKKNQKSKNNVLQNVVIQKMLAPINGKKSIVINPLDSLLVNQMLFTVWRKYSDVKSLHYKQNQNIVRGPISNRQFQQVVVDRQMLNMPDQQKQVKFDDDNIKSAYNPKRRNSIIKENANQLSLGQIKKQYIHLTPLAPTVKHKLSQNSQISNSELQDDKDPIVSQFKK